MNKTKFLLREELLLIDRKKLLSANSLALINNSNHVRYILGINTPLNETISFETRQQIIEAQLGLDKMLSSITNYIGNAVEKGKEKVITVIDDISNFKDVAFLIKDLIVSPQFMNTALSSLKRVATKIVDDIKNLITTVSGVLENLAPKTKDSIIKFIDHISKVLENLISGDGWVSFMKILAFCCLVKYLFKGVFSKLNSDEGMVLKISGYLDGMFDIMNLFKNFANSILESFNIQSILDWFAKIGVNNVLGPLLSGISIISILNEILSPVIKSVDWGKKLVKKL
jgi:hypothetical protein